MYSKEQMAQIAASKIIDGQIVNLGIGMPTLVANFLEHRPVIIHSENGLLGMGPYPTQDELDPQVINAGKETVTIKQGGSTFDSSLSFGMIRAGYIDVAILGGMQVASNGDLANWQVPEKKITGMGGAMDLSSGAKKLIVMMSHFDKAGNPKMLANCTIPITAKACVDTVITELGIFLVDKKNKKFIIESLALSISPEECQLPNNYSIF